MKSKEPGDLYILQDGTQAAPGDCKKGDDGVLRHENGLKVLMDSEGNPLTVVKQAEEGGAAEAAERGRQAAEGQSPDDMDNQAAAQMAEERPAHNRTADKPDDKAKAPKAE